MSIPFLPNTGSNETRSPHFQPIQQNESHFSIENSTENILRDLASRWDPLLETGLNSEDLDYAESNIFGIYNAVQEDVNEIYQKIHGTGVDSTALQSFESVYFEEWNWRLKESLLDQQAAGSIADDDFIEQELLALFPEQFPQTIEETIDLINNLMQRIDAHIEQLFPDPSQRPSSAASYLLWLTMNCGSRRNLILMEHLLNFEIDINLKSQILGDAAQSGDLEVVDLLLEKGMDPNVINCRGQTPLHRACSNYGHRRRNLDIASKLLDCSAKPDLVDHDGRTALHIAAAFGHYRIVALLMKNRANTALLDNQGHSPLHYAMQYDDPNHREVVNLLRGTDFTLQDSLDDTPMDIDQGSPQFDRREGPLHHSFL